MKFERPIRRSVVAWADQIGYPNDVVSGSPEHGGAHEHLLSLAVEMESDFEPWGKRPRDEEPSADCSCGCRHYAILAGPLGTDWGVCMNQRSPRAGLLTFEHQGCPQFEDGPAISDRGPAPPDCVRTVLKLDLLSPLGQLLSEKQTPQVVVNIRNQS